MISCDLWVVQLPEFKHPNASWFDSPKPASSVVSRVDSNFFVYQFIPKMLPAFPQKSRDGPFEMEINLSAIPLSHFGFSGSLTIFWCVHFTFLAGSFNLLLCVPRIHEPLRFWVSWNPGEGTSISSRSTKEVTREAITNTAPHTTSKIRKDVIAHLFLFAIEQWIPEVPTLLTWIYVKEGVEAKV